MANNTFKLFDVISWNGRLCAIVNLFADTADLETVDPKDGTTEVFYSVPLVEFCAAS